MRESKARNSRHLDETICSVGMATLFHVHDFLKTFVTKTGNLERLITNIEKMEKIILNLFTPGSWSCKQILFCFNNKRDFIDKILPRSLLVYPCRTRIIRLIRRARRTHDCLSNEAQNCSFHGRTHTHARMHTCAREWKKDWFHSESYGEYTGLGLLVRLCLWIHQMPW